MRYDELEAILNEAFSSAIPGGQPIRTPEEIAEARAARDADIVRRYAAGDGIKAIARDAGSSDRYVVMLAKRAGLPLRRTHNQMPADVAAEILRLYAAGAPLRSIAAAVGRSITAVHWCLRTHAIPRNRKRKSDGRA